MHIDLTPTSELSPAERQELADLNVLVNGPPEARQDPAARLVFGGYEDTRSAVRVRLDGLLVSCLFLAERRMLIDAQPTHVGGMRGVLTHPSYRRRGFGRAAMLRGQKAIWEEIQPELALLLSSEMAVPFYQSLGWQVFSGRLLCEQPGGVINYTELLPAQPPMLQWPQETRREIASVDMCGLPW